MSRGRRARSARASWVGATIAVLACWSCAAGPFVERDGGFTHRRHGFRVGTPPDSSGAWERDSVSGSGLAYRRSGPVRMTLASRCKEPITHPRNLARHLRIGIESYTMRHEGAVEAGGFAGWEQVFDVLEAGTLVQVKTVTVVVEPCVLDWLLTARDGHGFERALPDFDAWWQTLRAAPGAAADDGRPIGEGESAP